MTKSVSVIVRPKLVRAAPISYSSKYCSTIIAGLHQGGVGAEPGGGAFVGENTAIDADRAPRQRQRRAVGRTHLLRRLERGKRRIGGKGRPIVDRRRPDARGLEPVERSEEHTSELQSLMRISYAVFCLKKTKENNKYKTQRVTRSTRKKT